MLVYACQGSKSGSLKEPFVKRSCVPNTYFGWVIQGKPLLHSGTKLWKISRRRFSAILQSLYMGNLHKLSAQENLANDGKSILSVHLAASQLGDQLYLATRNKSFMSLLLIVNAVKIRKLYKPKRPKASQIKFHFRDLLWFPAVIT